MAIPYYANNIYDLHGITRPEAKCKKCGKQYKDHDRREHDQNGWVFRVRNILSAQVTGLISTLLIIPIDH